MDMNGLLSGLANSQGKGGKSCNNNNGNCGGGFGGGGILWIIILIIIIGGAGFGGQNEGGVVCGCEPKHVKKLCKVGGSSVGGYGGFGLGGLGGGLGCDGGGIWVIIIILLLFCGGNKGRDKGCTNNFINLESDDDC